MLLEEFQQRAFTPFGLRFIDYSVLRVLQLHGPPYQLSPTRLSEVVVRSSGGMTQILDRLERGDLVTRGPDPSDRRKVVVGLTPGGLRLVKAANRAWESQKADLLGQVPPTKLTQLEGAVRTLLQLFTEDFEAHSTLKDPDRPGVHSGG